jgi:glutamine amidotransferase
MIPMAVVDHGAGNLVSVCAALQRGGATPALVDRPADLRRFAGVVLPGVGATGAAMKRLANAGWIDPLAEVQVPLLGICLGMQLFFEWSEEDPAPCLGLIRGAVRRLRDTPRLPHIGWNDLAAKTADPLLAGLPERPVFYFVHSFAPEPSQPGVVVATTTYGSELVAMVRAGNLVGVQFHPERSGQAGHQLLANFVAECRAA